MNGAVVLYSGIGNTPATVVEAPARRCNVVEERGPGVAGSLIVNWTNRKRALQAENGTERLAPTCFTMRPIAG